MTNVKLKLMFFLLSALLTADIVHARPYSDNNTDIVYNYNSNDTYLPVEANTDTLIVKYNEEEVSRKANNNMDAMMTAEQDRDDDLSKKVIAAQIKPEDHESHKQNVHLDEIITAEQDRDRELSKKINKDQSMLKVSRKDADSFEKQMNISSPFLEELIDSETDREETLTDILFRGRSDSFVEPPRFEFLIAAKINESELTNKSASGRNDNALDRGDKNSSDILRKVDYVELVEVLRPGGGKGENKSAYNLLNITANEVDNDLAPDTILSVFSGFTDMQTLLLACFGTLLPLLGVLCAFFLIRCLCRRCCPGCCSKKSDLSESDSSEKNDTNQQDLRTYICGNYNSA
ncbi:hypothetical protein NE865_16366 [Phthorimaea operculella]|nr:hypothetical protein NE865_16366 [Phthorimaea operculella]